MRRKWAKYRNEKMPIYDRQIPKFLKQYPPKTTYKKAVREAFYDCQISGLNYQYTQKVLI